MSRARPARATDPNPSAPATPIGHPRLHLRSVGSTNERARALALAGAPHGTLVTARQQTAGRGRHGRRWSAPAGSSLLMSLLLRSPPSLLPLIAAVAVCDAVGDAVGDSALIKWPNDVVVASAVDPGLAKLAGILIEGRPRPAGHERPEGHRHAGGHGHPEGRTRVASTGEQAGWAVLGIGVNVAVRLEELPAALRLPAATLGLAPAQVEPMLARVLDALARRLAEPAGATLEAWRARDALRGREIAWEGGRGRAEGIDGDGRLVVALAGGGRTTLAAGEVRLSGIARR